MTSPRLVALFCPYFFSSIGGAQKYSADLLDLMSRVFPDSRFRLIVYRDRGLPRWLSLAEVNLTYGVSLPSDRIEVALVDDTGKATLAMRVRRMLVTLSKGFGANLLINAYHNKHLFPGSRRVHIVHFPSRRFIAGTGILHELRAHYDRLYGERYQFYVANSEYSLRYLAEWWPEAGSERCMRIYPVAYPESRMSQDDSEARPAKQRLILAFSRMDPKKCLHSLIEVFISLENRLPGWRLVIAGGVDGSHGGMDYLARLRAMAGGHAIEIVPNAGPERARELLDSASLFWHAMGLEVDEASQPSDLEHFGITTVEAMSASAVPLVIDKGGQREIVEDGRTGYRWRTLKELEERTIRLATDSSLMTRMAKEARESAASFGRARFDSEWTAALERLGFRTAGFTKRERGADGSSR